MLSLCCVPSPFLFCFLLFLLRWLVLSLYVFFIHVVPLFRCALDVLLLLVTINCSFSVDILRGINKYVPRSCHHLLLPQAAFRPPPLSPVTTSSMTPALATTLEIRIDTRKTPGRREMRCTSSSSSLAVVKFRQLDDFKFVTTRRKAGGGTASHVLFLLLLEYALSLFRFYFRACCLFKLVDDFGLLLRFVFPLASTFHFPPLLRIDRDLPAAFLSSFPSYTPFPLSLFHLSTFVYLGRRALWLALHLSVVLGLELYNVHHSAPDRRRPTYYLGP